MRYSFVFILLSLIIPYCHTPLGITAHPDDQTHTSGTATSAKMTTEMPHKPENVVVKPDTSKIKIDTVQRKRDSLYNACSFFPTCLSHLFSSSPSPCFLQRLS